MARFCIVSPVSVLHLLQAKGLLGVNHLVLAHDIVIEENSRHYERIFNAVKYHRGEDRLVILDNSVIELGGAVDLDLVVRAAKIVKPEVIVLPDVLEDSAKTITTYLENRGTWQQAFRHYTHNPFMYVPQGKTLEEFAICAEQSLDDQTIGWWGVPRNLVKLHGSRMGAIMLLHALNPFRKIHMLGFSDHSVDDLICANLPEVWSIDSAVPLRLIHPWDMFNKTPPRGNWWTESTWHPEHTPANLHKARKLFSGHKRLVP